ncbi:variant erythrocyte surface antigen-1 family protein [Babesia caballi]|uniref:Variant erythrocyte surface antigen-1 family protein n=1 Tax=Babesia caballi TaxID=5871 RepID=A0AAV4LYP2_BABCB|nr:variant erythrocyte surface antigen-1 family protein [Babesia caballi]
MSSGKTSLTIPPTNLKEAIDWVLRVSGRDSGQDDNGAIKGLAKEVKNLLDKDAGVVAQGILEVMGETFDKVVEGLNKLHGQNSISTFVLRGLLKKVRTNLEHVSDYGSAASPALIKKLCGLLQKDVESPGHGPIRKFAEGLKTFVETNNGIFKSQYVYAYNNSDAPWPTQPGEKERCAYIFLGLLPLVFYFLPYLYAKCTTQGDWHSESLSNGKLTIFMESDAVGFKAKLETSKQGKDVTTRIGEKCFQEIKNAYESANPSYGHFIKHYESRARALSSTISDSPLLKCFAVASPFFTPNETYDVQSTIPVSPSFLGYSGTAALAGGAYGFNLGGLGTLMSALLA